MEFVCFAWNAKMEQSRYVSSWISIKNIDTVKIMRKNHYWQKKNMINYWNTQNNSSKMVDSRTLLIQTNHVSKISLYWSFGYILLFMGFAIGIFSRGYIMNIWNKEGKTEWNIWGEKIYLITAPKYNDKYTIQKDHN